MAKDPFEAKIESSLTEIARTARSLLSRCNAISDLASQENVMEPLARQARNVARHLEQAIKAVASQDDRGGPLRIEREEDQGREKIVLKCVSSLMMGLDGTVHQGGRRAGDPVSQPRRGLHGYSWAIDVPELLGLLATTGKTGSLQITTLDETFTVVLEDGEIIHAISDNSPTGARLGDILVSHGFIAEEELMPFLRKLSNTRRKLGEALAEENFVTEAQLKQALETQVQYLFHRLFTVTDASYVFFEGDSGQQAYSVRMSVPALLLQSAVESDMANCDEEELAAIRAREAQENQSDEEAVVEQG